jgi:hypothetical protein
MVDVGVHPKEPLKNDLCYLDEILGKCHSCKDINKERVSLNALQ